MSICIISGSTRQASQSSNVSSYLKTILESHYTQQCTILDLANNPLPLFDEELFTSGPSWDKAWEKSSQILQQATGFIVVVPEWGGMVPPALKNLFTLCSTGELYHKPALLIAISAGSGGAYPIAELRMSSYKNTHICYLPEQIIIRNVTEFLQSQIHDTENYLYQRIQFCLKSLIAYIDGFKLIRNNSIFQDTKYPYGM